MSDSEIKKANLAKLREYHQQVFSTLGIPDAYFTGKMAYKPPGKNTVHISLFQSEVQAEKDIYIEFTSRNYTPEDPKRTLYKWKYNPHYKDDYEVTDDDFHRYLVPVTGLEVVSARVKDEKAGTFDLINPDEDPPFESMTLRDYAAIHLKVPCSTRAWLNEVIKKSNGDSTNSTH